jgi:hypothetical protein
MRFEKYTDSTTEDAQTIHIGCLRKSCVRCVNTFSTVVQSTSFVSNLQSPPMSSSKTETSYKDEEFINIAGSAHAKRVSAALDFVIKQNGGQRFDTGKF